MREASPPRGAQAALRAIRLLKLFTAERSELRLSEVSRLSGLNKTTAHRLLRALQSESLIEQQPISGTYRLGPGLMALGVLALSSNDLRLRARPILRRLAAETGETATLEVPVDASMLILDEVTGQHVVGAGGNVGTSWPIHATSTGKAFIAFEDQGIKRLDEELPRLTPRTIVCRQELEAQLVEVRRRGFAETIDELEEGFAGVGTVIRGATGELLGSLSVCGPTRRLTDRRRAQFGSALRAAARRLQPVF